MSSAKSKPEQDLPMQIFYGSQSDADKSNHYALTHGANGSFKINEFNKYTVGWTTVAGRKEKELRLEFKKDFKDKKSTEKKQAKKEEPPAPIKETPKLSDEQTMFKGMFDEVAGKSKARLISEANAIIAEMPVKDLAEALKGQDRTQGIKAVVFDGIITQRLLDISSDMGIGTLVASKMGKVSKFPDGLEILTKDDFQ